MGIKIGEVDVASQIVENEYRIAVQERVVDFLLSRATALTGPALSPQDLSRIRKEVVAQLQKKYPNSGITLKGLNDYNGQRRTESVATVRAIFGVGGERFIGIAFRDERSTTLDAILTYVCYVVRIGCVRLCGWVSSNLLGYETARVPVQSI